MFYWVVKAVLAPILRLLFRPWAEGTECVPLTGPAILASNHLSFSDHFFAPLPLPRKVVFLAKSEYFTGRGLKGLFSRAFFSGVGQIPVDRSGGEASERALATGLRVLAGGELLGIYPEGTRTPDGRLFRGKTGVARLALEARAPVIPCAMIGGFEFQPPGKIMPQFRIRPGVRFGKPLDFSRYYGLETDRIVLRAVTDEIIYEIMKLSGQEYVDEYAAAHKAARQAEKRAHLQEIAKARAADVVSKVTHPRGSGSSSAASPASPAGPARSGEPGETVPAEQAADSDVVPGVIPGSPGTSSSAALGDAAGPDHDGTVVGDSAAGGAVRPGPAADPPPAPAADRGGSHGAA